MEPKDLLTYYEKLSKCNETTLVATGWKEIKTEEADYLLECVPPRAWKNNAFLAGECVTCGLDGAIYDAVVTVDGKHYTRPAHLKYFSPDTYTAQVRAQFKI